MKSFIVAALLTSATLSAPLAHAQQAAAPDEVAPAQTSPGAAPNGATPNGATPNGATPNGATPNGAAAQVEVKEADIKAVGAVMVEVAKRYQKLRTFEVVIAREASGGLTAIKEEEFVRLQYFRQDPQVRFVLGQKLDDGWSKTIFDGKSVVNFASDWGKVYERRAPRPAADAIIGQKVKAELIYGDAYGPLTSLLIGALDFIEPLGSPFLVRADITTEGDLRVITVREEIKSALGDSLNQGEPVVKTLEMWVDKNSTLRKSRQYDSFKGAITETYGEQRFDPPFDPKMFRAAAPLGYKLRD